jgi:hypothetical protein
MSRKRLRMPSVSSDPTSEAAVPVAASGSAAAGSAASGSAAAGSSATGSAASGSATGVGVMAVVPASTGWVASGSVSVSATGGS